MHKLVSEFKELHAKIIRMQYNQDEWNRYVNLMAQMSELIEFGEDLKESFNIIIKEITKLEKSEQRNEEYLNALRYVRNVLLKPHSPERELREVFGEDSNIWRYDNKICVDIPKEKVTYYKIPSIYEIAAISIGVAIVTIKLRLKHET